MWLCIPTSLNVGTSEEWQSIFPFEKNCRKQRETRKAWLRKFYVWSSRVEICYDQPSCNIFISCVKFSTKQKKNYKIYKTLLLYLFCNVSLHTPSLNSLKLLKLNRFDKSHVFGLLFSYVCAILEFEKTSYTVHLYWHPSLPNVPQISS